MFSAPVAARGVWGVDIRSLDTGERLFQLHPDTLMMPASSLKIVTLAAAADALGWDYRYRTTLETSGAIVNGVLQGDLLIRGTGDPTINSRGERAAKVIDECVAALAAAGIQAIDGRLIGDDQAFDDEGIGAGWAWDYLQYGYAAPVGALQYNENLAALSVTPGASVGAPALIRIDAGSGLTLLNRTSTAAAGTDMTIDYRRRLDQPILEVTGTIPIGAATLARTVAVVNPTLFFAQSMKDALAARDLTISGTAADFDDVAAEMVGAGAGARPEPRVLATVRSPPLADIAAVLMKASQNLYGETLLKSLGAARGSLGTVAAGRAALQSTLAAWGIKDDSYVAVDGSGLSRYNYVTAATLTAVLERVYRDPRHRDAFLATLPIAGKDGTLATRMRLTRAEGNAVAKTGSISNVRSLSGFVRTRDGEMLVFSILANDFVIPAATINWIADLAVETMANFNR